MYFYNLNEFDIGLVYIEYLIRILTSNFLLNYLNFGDACKCVHDTCI